MGRVIDIAHENLQDDAAENRSGNAFQCLDIWNLRQGELRLWLYSSVVGYLVIVSIYWQVWELLCLSVENMDTRDIVDDYRLSHAGVHLWHAEHWQSERPNLELSVSVDHACGLILARRPCEPNEIVEHTDSDPDMIDPRFQAIYGSNLRLNFMQPSDTGYEYDITAYEYTLDMASTAARYNTVSIIIDVGNNNTDSDMMQPSCIGCHPASLPLYHIEYTDCVDCELRRSTIEVRYLVKAVVEAAWYQNQYQVQQVQGTYSSEVWSGAVGETPRFNVESTDVQVVLTDQSQPLPYSPAFTGTWRFLVGFCIFPILTPLVTVTLRVFLQIWLHIRFRTNQGLPPPFYRSFRKFRGW